MEQKYSVPEGLQVLNFSGNQVKMEGYCNCCMAPKNGKELKAKKFVVTDGINQDELLMGTDTMRAWKILPKNFPELDLDAFYTSEDIMKR